MRAAASFSYEGLVATAIEPHAADFEGVLAIGCESRLYLGLETYKVKCKDLFLKIN